MNFGDIYKDLTELALTTAKQLGASYADIRIVENLSQSIETKNLELARINENKNLGFGIRVIYNGGWGFASSYDLSPPSIKKTVNLAIEIGKASSVFKEKINLASEPVHTVIWQSQYKKNPFDIPLEIKINELILKHDN